MPLYFFDVHDGITSLRDDVGIECHDPEAAASHAKEILPAIAADEVPRDGDRQSYTVLVTDEEGHPIYSAALSFVGTWLTR